MKLIFGRTPGVSWTEFRGQSTKLPVCHRLSSVLTGGALVETVAASFSSQIVTEAVHDRFIHGLIFLQLLS